jgi:hypothetical protein
MGKYHSVVNSEIPNMQISLPACNFFMVYAKSDKDSMVLQ